MSLYNLIKDKIKQEKIKLEQKVTICYKNEFGFLNVVHTRIYFYEEKPTYMDCPRDRYLVNLYHLPKGKKNIVITPIDPCSSLVIYDGYKDINSDNFNYKKTKEDGLEIFESKYTAFNEDAFMDLLRKHPNYILRYIGGRY